MTIQEASVELMDFIRKKGMFPNVVSIRNDAITITSSYTYFSQEIQIPIGDYWKGYPVQHVFGGDSW